MAEAANSLDSAQFSDTISNFWANFAHFLPIFRHFDPYPLLYKVNNNRLLAEKRSMFLLYRRGGLWTLYLRRLGSPVLHRASSNLSAADLRARLEGLLVDI